MLDNNILEIFFISLNKRDLGEMDKLFTETAEFYFPKARPMLGRDRIVRFFRILFRQYPELSFKEERSIIEGSSAAVHWTNRGRNKKGESYENEGVTIFELEGDLIAFMSDFFKDTGKF